MWGVTASGLPALGPGGTLTLTIDGDYYRGDLSQIAWPLPPGTPVYAQVDSANTDTDYGSVLETHEIAGQTYNNISEKTLVTSTTSGSPAPNDDQSTSGNLPTRP